jgi:hypothetical protein
MLLPRAGERKSKSLNVVSARRRRTAYSSNPILNYPKRKFSKTEGMSPPRVFEGKLAIVTGASRSMFEAEHSQH